MKQIYISFIGFIVFLLSACTSGYLPESHESSSHSIYLAKGVEPKDIGDYLSLKRFIPLETTEESLLANITKIRVTESKVIVFDSKAERVLLFDISGKFIRTIGSKGPGPEQYRSVVDFDFDYEREKVCFLSRGQRSIIEYDLSGDFHRKVDLGFFPLKLATHSFGYALFLGYFDDLNRNLRYVDLEGSIVNTSFPFPETVVPMGFSFSGALISCPKSVLYVDATTSVIFDVSGAKQRKAYELKFEGLEWPYEKRHDFEGFMTAVSSMEISYLTSEFCENDDALFFQYVVGNRFLRAIFFKTSERVILLDRDSSNLLERSVGVPVGWTNDGDFVSVVNFISYASWRSLERSDKTDHADIGSKMYTRSIDDNPSLIIYEVVDK